MEKKQTAVEWLMENLHIAKDPFGQAKQMEKEQIIKANRDGVDMVLEKKYFITGEKYYNETYKP